MNKTVTIYALLDPRDMRCRYVGKTKHDVQKRLRGHINDAKRRAGEIPRFRWINALEKSGVLPLAVVLEKVSADDWQAAEQMWVCEMRHRFPDLLNATDGGDGIHGHIHSEQTKRRQSEAARARYQDPEESRRTAQAVRAAFDRPEVKAKLKENARIKFSDPEFLKGLRERNKKVASTPEARLRISLLHKGKTLSDEAKKKIGDANRGRQWTPEQKKAASGRRAGQKHSPETIAKMRAAITPEMKAASADRMRIANAQRTPEQRQANSDRMKALWQQRKAMNGAMQNG